MRAASMIPASRVNTLGFIYSAALHTYPLNVLYSIKCQIIMMGYVLLSQVQILRHETGCEAQFVRILYAKNEEKA